MKVIFFLVFLLKNGINPTEGKLTVYFSSRAMILRYFIYPSNNNLQACCKFIQSECLIFMRSNGYVAPTFQGRISIEYYIGSFDVIFTNPRMMDAGKYRCGISGLPYTYEDVVVTKSDFLEFSGINPAPLAPKSSIKPTVLTSVALVSEEPSENKSMVFKLAAVCSGLAFALIIAVMLVVFRLKKSENKSRDKRGSCGSHNTTLQSPEEQSGIIYSVMDFKPNQDPSELYANLQIHSERDTGRSSNCSIKSWESVVYSTISIAKS
ncbi:uncharacterized protein LOC127631342 isoform X1 [Xyrauchen texanus]|uniref:uncharacterized protein LOC127631342 isoform X1 n=1 Tax=Xyrauchen texanus TaxID=154827 RepID=UPI00224191C4|nr:uncharacterized protein LOC127631342 isoform X1 [Xyrauchen texanus]XP_051965414.1 uncharacterized protein LOC127631342 isoform X1 [Xyrauchen texanus]